MISKDASLPKILLSTSKFFVFVQMNLITL